MLNTLFYNTYTHISSIYQELTYDICPTITYLLLLSRYTLQDTRLLNYLSYGGE